MGYAPSRLLWLAAPALALSLAVPLSGQDFPKPQGEAEALPLHHRLTLFVGASSDFQADNGGFAVGTSYRYELAPALSIGPVVEVSFFTNQTSYLFLAALHVTLKDRIEMTAAPGLAIEDSKDRLVHSEKEFAFRLGAGYEVPLKDRFSLTPEVNFDFAGGNTRLVYGASLGIEF